MSLIFKSQTSASKLFKPRNGLSKNLTYLATILWVVSLFLPAYSTYSETVIGFQVLFMGWLGPLVGNIAWYANLFFLYNVLCNGEAYKASFVAGFVALSMFFFKEVLLNEGGTTASIYGYGFGAIVWLISIWLMSLVTSLRLMDISYEANDHMENNLGRQFRNASGTILILILTITGFFAVTDRIKANKEEKIHLEKVAYKLGDVCAIDIPMQKTRFTNIDGAVELILSETKFDSSEIRRLLDWGFPVVRYYERDFYYKELSNKEIMTSIPAASEVIGVIDFNTVGSDKKIITLKVTDFKTKQTLVEQTWYRGKQQHNYCPNYSGYAEDIQQPRKMIAEIFGLSPARIKQSNLEVIDNKFEQNETINLERPIKSLDDNKNCPIALNQRSYGFGGEVHIGKRIFYPDSQSVDTFCTSNSPYLKKVFNQNIENCNYCIKEYRP